MNAEQWRRAREVFDEAMERDGEARATYFDEACAEDAAVREAVERLIADTTDAGETGQLLERGVSENIVRKAMEQRGLEGQRVGDFEVLGVLGSGGMATVLKAEQQHPKRTVALKMMRFGLMSEDLRRRFEYESEILGSLRHPGIAQVFASGTHRDQWSGQDLPYFAMEYVQGARTLDRFVDAEAPDLATTLRLFVQICHAVHYGHQRGVIHRDLKPQNILIDDRGQPKVIDFGIARATASELDGNTLRTTQGELLGTLRYMSPEQIDPDQLDLDLRCDVYALGVVLYELLAGKLPFDVTGVPITAAVDVIRHATAPRPSTVATRFDSQRLQGDLDWIVQKAIEKEAARRYTSAHELAADVERALTDRPVLARPPSRIYLIGKFVRRHRLGVSAAAIVLVALVTGLAMVSASLATTKRAEKAVRESLAEAQLEAATRKDVNDFLKNMLSSVDPYADGLEVKVIDILERASARADTLHAERPGLAMALQRTLGRTYLRLALHKRSRKHLERAVELGREHLGVKHRRTLLASIDLAFCLLGLGHKDAAKTLGEQALADLEQIPEHDPIDVANAQIVLAQVADQDNELERAVELYESARAIFAANLAPDALLMMQACAGLGHLYTALGKRAAAHEMLEFVQERGAAALGPEHPTVLVARNNLATLLLSEGKFAAAAEIYAEVVEIEKRVLGESSRGALRTLNNLAAALQKLGKFDEAEKRYRLLVERRRAGGIYEHYETGIALGNLGVCLESQDQLKESEERFTECFAMLTKCGIPQRHWITASFRKGLGLVRTKQKRYPEAEKILQGSLSVLEKARGDQKRRIRRTLEALVALYDQWGKPEQAEALRKRLAAL